MHTRVLMISSAALMAVIGLAASFMPQEVLGLHGTVPDNATVLFVQMAGAVYLGFAMLNWSARGILIGGIYARPVAAGNFLHFVMVAITLIKAAIGFGAVELAISAAVFSVFAIWFGLVMFKPPV
ncbi:MAG: hypothetical protein ACR2QT_14795 [Woeseiaceae bacterium]